MVGIPGRSTGCHTCRRRKVKCDATHPKCDRCAKAGLACEGYAKGAVFLNRNAQGLIKRKPLEEILPDASGAAPVTIPKQLDLTPEWKQRIEGFFLEKYLSAKGASNWNPSGNYVADAMALPRDPLLESAVQALSLTRVGRMNDDYRLVEEGKKFYVLALQRLHAAMATSNEMIEDGTFAAAKLMTVHELYEPTDSTNKAIYDHTMGIARMIEMRGVERHQTGAMKSLMQASRYSSMVTAIKGYSQDSMLASPRWWIGPRETIDTFEQNLYDFGFELAFLLRGVNELHMLGSVSTEHPTIEELLTNCIRIESGLQRWCKDFVKWLPSQMTWRADILENKLSEKSPPTEFPHIRVAHAVLDFWALLIIMSMALGELAEAAEAQNIFVLSPFSDGTFQQMLHLRNKYNPEAQIELGRKILASFAFCQRTQMGSSGSQHIFALGVALSLFRSSSDPRSKELTQEAEAVCHEMKTISGLRFVQNEYLTNRTSDVKTMWRRL